ncbi:MAG: DNA photolyase [Clostridiaceae bacterium]|nr:DNA photolyase [Clostridiaceae bacterium]
MSCSKSSSSRTIRRIYVEEEAFGYAITSKVLEKYSDCDVVKIKNYKDVFNRTRQNFILQKKFPQLILAVKKDSFIYEGSAMCQSFGHKSYYYATLMVNCIFDCQYCFLQGMYNSSYIVCFVNVEDFAKEFARMESGSMVAISYETDFIAHHSIVPCMEYIYDYIKEAGWVTFEIRTKSANSLVLSKFKPVDNLILAYTLTPQKIIDSYETFTPNLDARIKAVNHALDMGFKVRVCFDPVFADEDYEDFFYYVFERIDGTRLYDIGYGFFRMPKEQFAKVFRTTKSVVFAKDYVEEDGVITYSEAMIHEASKRHLDIIGKHVDKEKIYIL